MRTSRSPVGAKPMLVLKLHGGCERIILTQIGDALKEVMVEAYKIFPKV